MAEEEVGLRLSLKNRREVASGVHQVGTELDRVGDQAADVNRQSRLAARGFAAFGRAGRAAGRVAALGIGAASAAVVAAGYAATKVVKASLSEAREAQKVSAVTRAEIKATGGVANVTAKSLSRLTGAISRKVGIDDEAIQSGANLLLTFKNVRNEVGKGNDIFNQATQAAVDLSAAGFGSIESGSKMLGKALNDPIKGVTALSRAGVTFSAQQIETIKGMVEQNDLLGAQKVILGEVKSEVGGVAAEQATWGDKAKVSLGNIEESLGTALLPLFDRVERWFVNKGAPALENYVGIFEKKGIPKIREYADMFFDKGIPAMKQFYDKAKPVAEEVLPALGSTLGTVKDTLADAAPLAKDLIGYFNDMPDWAKKAVVEGGIAGFAGTKLGLIGGKGGLSGGLLGGISKGAPLPVYVVNNGVGGGVGGVGGIPTGGTPGAFGTKVPPLGSLPAFVPPLGIGGVRPMPTALDTPSDAQDLMNGVSREQLDRTAKAFASLPRKLQTEVVLKGAPESRKEAMELVRQYDLTPKEKRTLFTVLDIPDNQHTVDKYQHVLGATPKKVSTDVSLFGVASASQQVSTLLAQLHALTDHGWNFTALGNVPGSAPHREHGGPVKAGQGYVVGERRPEYFVPKVDGTVLPKVPDMPSFDNEDWGGHVGSGEPIVVQVVLERKVLAEATFDVARDKLART